MIRIRDIDHLVLRVIDLDRLPRFYREVLAHRGSHRGGERDHGVPDDCNAGHGRLLRDHAMCSGMPEL